MAKSRHLIVVIVIVLAVVSLACGGSVSTANIRSATLSASASGTPETTVFRQDDLTVYCIVTLANAPSDTTVKAVWTAVDVDGVDPNTLIDESELTSGDAELTFEIANSQLWPVGSYKVDLYLNDKLDQTLEYEVQ
ncbi:MAG: hypothetical protein MUF84_15150 [Anaerolineae bacterium]|jgi:hypothetical protein|nr:hypothetical protein [Anaerolineae bacterium]